MKFFQSTLKICAVALSVGLLSTTALAGPKDGPKASKSPTILEVAGTVNSTEPFAGSFDILIEAVNAANPAVAQTLGGVGQFTVFAPTDLAFETFFNLSEGEIIAALQGGGVPEALLTEILLYHVAKGRRDADDVTTSTQIRMLNGERVGVMGANLTDIAGNVSSIDVVNVPARNGIIHVISGVLDPRPAD